VEHIHQMFGTVKSEVFGKIGTALYQYQLGESLKIISQLNKEGKDPRIFIKNFNIFLRDMLIKNYNSKVFRMAKIFTQAENDMRYAAQPQMVFELAIIEAAQRPDNDLQNALERIAALEKKLKSLQGAD